MADEPKSVDFLMSKSGITAGIEKVATACDRFQGTVNIGLQAYTQHVINETFLMMGPTFSEMSELLAEYRDLLDDIVGPEIKKFDHQKYSEQRARAVKMVGERSREEAEVPLEVPREEKSPPTTPNANPDAPKTEVPLPVITCRGYPQTAQYTLNIGDVVANRLVPLGYVGEYVDQPAAIARFKQAAGAPPAPWDGDALVKITSVPTPIEQLMASFGDKVERVQVGDLDRGSSSKDPDFNSA